MNVDDEDAILVDSSDNIDATSNDGFDGSNDKNGNIANNTKDDTGTNPRDIEANKKDARRLLYIKLFVIFILIVSAVGISLGVYKYVTDNEMIQFETKIEYDSNKLLNSIGTSFDQTLGAINAVTVTFISYTKSQNGTVQQWPFVTLPDFSYHMSKILPLTLGLYITVLPIVTPEQKSKWEIYAYENDIWVNESLALEGMLYNFRQQKDFHNNNNNNETAMDVTGSYDTVNWLRSNNIYETLDIIYPNITRIMCPQWQTWPSGAMDDAFPYNFDWNSAKDASSIRHSIENQRPVISTTFMIPKPNDPVSEIETEQWAPFFQVFLKPGESAVEPLTVVFYPMNDNVLTVETVFGNEGIDNAKVFNDMKDINSTSASNNTYMASINGTSSSTNAASVDNKGNGIFEADGLNTSSEAIKGNIVGLIAIPIYWREFFKNVLTIGSDGVVVVVRSPCNDPFTYQVNGPNVVYLGVGDHHDPKYDEYETVRNVSDLQSLDGSNSKYNGLPLDKDFCPYTIHIYPSDTMKDYYSTNDGLYIIMTILVAFLFTSCVFLVYDWYVERRQLRVMTSANRSSAIVSSLFPSTVRDQLYSTAAATNDTVDKPKKRLQWSDSGNGNSPTSSTISGSPIAEVYPDTTVIFADIVGFTAWSSTRGPIDVFHLLETLYAGFDTLAKVHGVFKIETIGDSYVAVVGLPQPRKRHATIMAKFANAIRAKMMELVKDLEESLGPGTSSLALRIGLNSGPTTAGVLRGEKARFQLFGDTVNTAARMESNGAPYKIHISEATAHLLHADGRGHWITPRNEMITAKGKGMMQTYWCEPSATTSDTRQSSSQPDSSTTHDDMDAVVQVESLEI